MTTCIEVEDSKDIIFEEFAFDKMIKVRSLRKLLSNHFGKSPCFMYESDECFNQSVVQREKIKEIVIKDNKELTKELINDKTGRIDVRATTVKGEEIDFIELSKFSALQNKDFKESALQRWLAFLEKDINKNMLQKLMNMEPAIKMAEEKLDYLSSDPYTIELYKAREDSEYEKANFYSSGQDNKAREIAK